MTERQFDPIGALSVLNQHGVDYILIGGFAGKLHGSPVLTVDIDICYDRARANLERLAAALREIHADLRGAPPGLPFRLDGQTLAAGDSFTFVTDVGDLDVLGTPAGVAGYGDLLPNSVVVDLDGVKVRVAALDDLIRMKRAAGRPRDRAHLEILLALRDELDQIDEAAR